MEQLMQRPSLARFELLRQAGVSMTEGRLASAYSMLRDIKLKSASMADLGWMAANPPWRGEAARLRRGDAGSPPFTVPVGSVAFCEQVLQQQGGERPTPLSYPIALYPFLGRTVWKTTAGRAQEPREKSVFVKPVRTKSFTGFVLPGTDAGPDRYDNLSEHDHQQLCALQALPADTPVWVSEVLELRSEWRCYMDGTAIAGYAQYDDSPEDGEAPPIGWVCEMAAFWAASSSAERDNTLEALSQKLGLPEAERIFPEAMPCAYTLDVAQCSDGSWVLVEVNDFWALGHYKGKTSISADRYFELLSNRWEELLRATPSRMGR